MLRRKTKSIRILETNNKQARYKWLYLSIPAQGKLNCSRYSRSSWRFCHHWLQSTLRMVPELWVTKLWEQVIFLYMCWIINSICYPIRSRVANVKVILSTKKWTCTRKGKIYTQILGKSISLTLIKIAVNFDRVVSLVASLNFRCERTAHNGASMEMTVFSTNWACVYRLAYWLRIPAN